MAIWLGPRHGGITCGIAFDEPSGEGADGWGSTWIHEVYATVERAIGEIHAGTISRCRCSLPRPRRAITVLLVFAGVR